MIRSFVFSSISQKVDVFLYECEFLPNRFELFLFPFASLLLSLLFCIFFFDFIVCVREWEDEADALADDIAILVNGRVKARGSPLQLKSVLGTGHKLSISYPPWRAEVAKR